MHEWMPVSDELWTTVDDQGRFWGIAHRSDLNDTVGRYVVTGPDYEATEHATWGEAAAAVAAIIDGTP